MSAILQAIGTLGMLVVSAALVVVFAALIVGTVALVRSYRWL